MPSRDWLSYAALVGCLIASSWTIDLYAQERPPGEVVSSQEGEWRDDISNYRLVLPLEILNQTNLFRCDLCREEEQRREQEDLIAQRSMAISAEQTVNVGWGQIAVSVFALVLLWLTYKETKATATASMTSAKSAQNSAMEARRQAGIAELSMRNLERPYLFPEIIDVRYLIRPSPNIPFIECLFVNYGRTPAILESVYIRLEAQPCLPLRLPIGIAIKTHEVVAPGAKSNPTSVFVEDSAAGKYWAGAETTKLILHGIIKYRDATGGTFYADEFCFRPTENAERWISEGGETYNKRTSIGSYAAIERVGEDTP
jgi:hypothetical protein